MERFVYDYSVVHYDHNEPDYVRENLDLLEVLSEMRYRSRSWARTRKDANGYEVREEPPKAGREVVKKYRLELVDEDVDMQMEPK